MTQTSLSGVVTPILTPFDAQGRIEAGLFRDHAKTCLAKGSHFLAPFGTTGEAASISIAARMAALENLVASGAAAASELLPGTGVTSLEDTMSLTAHAAELGVSAVLILPPFFYRNADDTGLYRYFAALIERLGAVCPKIILYHIPQQAGVGISPALTRRLALDFPGIIAGYKDSSGNWTNTTQILRAAPDIAVFPASETLLPQAMASGGAGCISATCNVNASGIRALYDSLNAGKHAEAKDRTLDVSHVRKSVEGVGLIRGCKSIVAARTGAKDWLHCLPPLPDATADLSPDLATIAQSQMDANSAM